MFTLWKCSAHKYEFIQDPSKTEEFVKLALEFKVDNNSMINWTKEKSTTGGLLPIEEEAKLEETIL